MPIHHLHEPVDVFSEWLDDCEAAAQGKPTGQAAAAVDAAQNDQPQYDISDDEDDDDLGPPMGLNSGTEVATASSEKSKEKNSGDQTTTTYADLGLDDSSDDDSD